MSRPLIARKLIAATAAVLLWAGGTERSSLARPVTAEERVTRTDDLPKRLRGIDVVERLDERLPADLAFVDDDGRKVVLGDYLRAGRPLLLTLNYSTCPMLCSLQLTGLTKALGRVRWTAGREFEMVTVILDPKEGAERAKKTKARYVREYGRVEAAHGWHFLTGAPERIAAVADAIGFRYGYNEERAEFVHPAAFVIVTPDGRIARYLYGIEQHPRTLELSLIEASEGRIGSSVDRLVLYCFHYDASEGRYAPVAMNIMRVAASAGALGLGGMLAGFFAVDLRRKKLSKTQAKALATST